MTEYVRVHIYSKILAAWLIVRVFSIDRIGGGLDRTALVSIFRKKGT